MSVAESMPDWAAPPATVLSATAAAKCALFDKAQAAISRFHSTTAYLNHHMPDEHAKKHFLTWQLETLPMQDDVVYCFDAQLPAVEKDQLGTTKPTVLHLAAFAWGDSSSVKPTPGEDTTSNFRTCSSNLKMASSPGGSPFLWPSPTHARSTTIMAAPVRGGHAVRTSFLWEASAI